MQRKDHTAAQYSEEQEKGRNVIKPVYRDGEYLCEQYYATGHRQTCMHEAKTGGALALTHTKVDQVKTESCGRDEKEKCCE